MLRARDAQLPACPNLDAYRALALAGELLVQGERTPQVARRIAVGGGRERVGPGPGEVVEGPRPLHRRRPVVCQPSVLARRKRLSRIARLERVCDGPVQTPSPPLREPLVRDLRELVVHEAIPPGRRLLEHLPSEQVREGLQGLELREPRGVLREVAIELAAEHAGDLDHRAREPLETVDAPGHQVAHRAR